MKKVILTFILTLLFSVVGFSQVIEMSLGGVTRFGFPNFLEMSWSELKEGGYVSQSPRSTSGLEQTIYTLNMNDGILVREWTEGNGVRVSKTHKILETKELDLEGERFRVNVEWNESNAEVFTNGCTYNGEQGTCIVVFANPTVHTGYEEWKNVDWVPELYVIGFTGLMNHFTVVNMN